VRAVLYLYRLDPEGACDYGPASRVSAPSHYDFDRLQKTSGVTNLIELNATAKNCTSKDLLDAHTYWFKDEGETWQNKEVI